MESIQAGRCWTRASNCSPSKYAFLLSRARTPLRKSICPCPRVGPEVSDSEHTNVTVRHNLAPRESVIHHRARKTMERKSNQRPFVTRFHGARIRAFQKLRWDRTGTEEVQMTKASYGMLVLGTNDGGGTVAVLELALLGCTICMISQTTI